MSDGIGKNPRQSIGGRAKQQKSPSPISGGPAKGRAKSTGDVGRALRSVYDDTLGERVPDDFLDLLGKLS